MPNYPKHDDLIAELIHPDRVKLKVVRDFKSPMFHADTGLWLPDTKIMVFREKPGRFLPACFQPDSSMYPRMKLRVRVITWHEVWLFAHRISGVSRYGVTEYEYHHMDRNRANYNDWNLNGLHRLEHMEFHREGVVDFPEEYLEELRVLQDQVFLARKEAGLPSLSSPDPVDDRPF